MQPELLDFLGSFPEWAFAWAWTVDYKTYEFRM
jgi:hypothetical protein